MPIREFACDPCNVYTEVIHPSVDPVSVPVPLCPRCEVPMALLISLPNLDTETNFKGRQIYRGVDGRTWNIDTLHKMRAVEHAYQETGHDVRFDAYSGNPSNPDPVDGYGPEYHDGSTKSTSGKVYVDTK